MEMVWDNHSREKERQSDRKREREKDTEKDRIFTWVMLLMARPMRRFMMTMMTNRRKSKKRMCAVPGYCSSYNTECQRRLVQI